MGRRRKHRPDLPANVTHEHGAYYWRAPDRRRHRLGPDFAAAMRAWAALVGAPPAGSTVGAVMDTYLASARFARLAPRTQDDYLDAIGRLRARFGDLPVRRLTPASIYDYMDTRGAPVRANREVATLSAVLNEAVRAGLIEANPCRQVRREPEAPRSAEVTDAAIAGLRPFCPPWLRAYLDVKLATGLRQGDMLRLTDRAVRPDGLFVVTGKRGRRMLFLWTPALRKGVAAAQAARQGARARSEALFPSRSGRALTGAGFKTAWSRAWSAALDAHRGWTRFAETDLRSKVADDAIELGEDATELLGHGSDAVTRRHYLRRTRKVRALDRANPTGAGVSHEVSEHSRGEAHVGVAEGTRTPDNRNHNPGLPET